MGQVSENHRIKLWRIQKRGRKDTYRSYLTLSSSFLFESLFMMMYIFMTSILDAQSFSKYHLAITFPYSLQQEEMLSMKHGWKNGIIALFFWFFTIHPLFGFKYPHAFSKGS